MVICGPSGSGKSTLIRTVNGLESIDSGEIIVLPELDERTRRSGKIGMVFQHFNLFPHLTVLENLTLAPIRTLKLSAQEAKERAYHFLQRVKITDQTHKYPIQLSGGQQQRVAIARSLCMQPEILLFDEPTSALDPETINEVLEVMVDLAQDGITMMCVTHEMGFARTVANRVVFLEEGKIVEETDSKEFFTNPKTSRAKEFLSKVMH